MREGVERTARIVRAVFVFVGRVSWVIALRNPTYNLKGIKKSNNSPILVNQGYTIEPGIYIKGEFGVRSEIDFYIDKSGKVVVTTGLEKNIIRLVTE